MQMAPGNFVQNAFLDCLLRAESTRDVAKCTQEKSQRQNLRVYPARVNGEGKIFVKFAPE